MKPFLKKVKILLIFTSILPLCHCAIQSGPVYTKNGKEYGEVEGIFRGMWWNYYEQGLSYSDGEFFDDALFNFKKAIEKANRDQRKARTYGTRFMDYFPHRETGIIYYKTGKLKEAQRELELSWDHYKSAKTRYYLDLVRRSIIEQKKQKVDPPRVTIHYDEWTRDNPVPIHIDAEDELYISEFSIMGIPIDMKESKRHIHLERSLMLPHGVHRIEVEAKNLMGKTTKKQAIIHVDREGPSITIDELQVNFDLQEKEILITGFIEDKAGVSKLIINSQEIPIAQSSEIHFSNTFALFAADHLDIITYDRLGNITYTKIPIPNQKNSRLPFIIASADTEIKGLSGNSDAPSPLTIRFLRKLQDPLTVYNDEICLQIEVKSYYPINKLKVNNTPLRKRKGKYIRFDKIEKLKIGENSISIEAWDENWNYSKKKITVIREISPARLKKNRLSISILPFQHNKKHIDTSLTFQGKLTTALNQCNRFRILKGEKGQLRLEGEIVETGTGIEIYTEAIDKEDNEVKATVEVYDDKKHANTLWDLAKKMALRIHEEFPLIEGNVLSCKNNQIISDIIHPNLKVSSRLIIFREETLKYENDAFPSETDDKIIVINNTIGLAKITDILFDEKITEAELLECNNSTIRPWDKVITE